MKKECFNCCYFTHPQHMVRKCNISAGICTLNNEFKIVDKCRKCERFIHRDDCFKINAKKYERKIKDEIRKLDEKIALKKYYTSDIYDISKIMEEIKYHETKRLINKFHPKGR